VPEGDIATAPRTLGLLLLDGFALMSYASVIEPYRAANLLAGRQLYRWAHISVDGEPGRASNGATILCDHAIAQGPAMALHCDTLFVFAAGDPTRFHDPRTFAWLRAIAARGTVIAGISAGPYILARAGLLDGYRMTIHWEHRPALVEEFPAMEPQPGLYVIDRRRVTCAGGMAGMDLALELIEREQGHALAAQVAEWFIRSEPRAADRPQRSSLRDRYGVANDRVLKVLARMETHVEEPATREELAAVAGVSVRQLERLFAVHLRASVGDTYRGVRLALAEQLLRTTALPITQVALACGYSSASHFSRAYARHYGEAPSLSRSRAQGAPPPR